MSYKRDFPIQLVMKKQVGKLVERQMRRHHWTTLGLAKKAMLTHQTVKNFLDPDKNCFLSTFECICWACDIVVDVRASEMETNIKLRVVR